MTQITKIKLAWDMHNCGVSKVEIAKTLEVHRETVAIWITGISKLGVMEYMELYQNAKKGPRQKRRLDPSIKALIYEIRVRESDCCGEKIAYFLEKENGIKVSVSKMYQVLGEKIQLRTKWKKNQPRGFCPDASAPREVVQMDTIDFGNVFAFTAVDIFTREAEVGLAPSLKAVEGRKFLEFAMERRYQGYSRIIQTDGGSEFEADFKEVVGKYCLGHRVARPYKKNEQSFIESFNRTVRKECLGWFKYDVDEIPRLTEQVEQFLYRYHYHRPHMAFDPMRPPLPWPSAEAEGHGNW